MRVDIVGAIRRLSRRFAPIALGVILGSPGAFAANVLYSASLAGTQEVPPNASTASGFATVLLDTVANTITVNESFSNLSSTAIASHIHAAPVGVNGPVIIPLTGVPAATSGSIPSQSISITPTQVAQLQSGGLYVNIHSITFPGGEIRGQLVPPCAVNPNIIVDGGFEANTVTFTNPNWSSTSTAFGSSLCSIATCGTGNGSAVPRTGNGWVWFDGTGDTATELATAAQTVTLPLGATVNLTYYEQFGAVTAPAASQLTVSVDGNVVQTIAEPATADGAYILRTVDLSAFANGTARSISFNYSRPGGGSVGSDNATVDDVALAISACPVSNQPVFLGAASRKTHASGAGNFDIPLSPIMANTAIEPRQGPVSLVFSFDRPMNSSAIFAIPEGSGTYAGVQTSGNDIVLNFTNVPDQSYFTVTLTGAHGLDGSTGGAGSARVGLLVGDVNQSRAVSVADLGLVNGQLSQPVTAANFLKDVNLSGTISLADKGITNAALTHSLPPP